MRLKNTSRSISDISPGGIRPGDLLPQYFWCTLRIAELIQSIRIDPTSQTDTLHKSHVCKHTSKDGIEGWALRQKIYYSNIFEVCFSLATWPILFFFFFA